MVAALSPWGCRGGASRARLALVGGAWLVVSLELPHRDVPWPALLPGAVLVGVGLLFLNVFNVYVTTRLVEERSNTYGALGIAAALLFSLVLVGRWWWSPRSSTPRWTSGALTHDDRS